VALLSRSIARLRSRQQDDARSDRKGVIIYEVATAKNRASTATGLHVRPAYGCSPPAASRRGEGASACVWDAASEETAQADAPRCGASPSRRWHQAGGHHAEADTFLRRRTDRPPLKHYWATRIAYAADARPWFDQGPGRAPVGPGRRAGKVLDFRRPPGRRLVRRRRFRWQTDRDGVGTSGLWEPTGKLVRRIPPGHPLAFAPTARPASGGGGKKTVHLWESPPATSSSTSTGRGSCGPSCLPPDGKLSPRRRAGTVRIIDLPPQPKHEIDMTSGSESIALASARRQDAGVCRRLEQGGVPRASPSICRSGSRSRQEGSSCCSGTWRRAGSAPLQRPSADNVSRSRFRPRHITAAAAVTQDLPLGRATGKELLFIQAHPTHTDATSRARRPSPSRPTARPLISAAPTAPSAPGTQRRRSCAASSRRRAHPLPGDRAGRQEW